MMIKKLALTLCCASSLSIVSLPVAALEAGDWLLRGRIVKIEPNESSENITANGNTVDDTRVGVDGAYTLDIDITYMFTPNIGAELLLGIPSKHDMTAQGAALRALAPNEVIQARVLPPTLLFQYHITSLGQFRPYIGIGLNYANFLDEEATTSLNTGLGGVNDVKLKSSWGLAGQIGADYDLGNDWFINADVKYLDIDTTATFGSGALGNIAVDVDMDPWVFGLGIGKRF